MTTHTATVTRSGDIERFVRVPDDWPVGATVEVRYTPNGTVGGMARLVRRDVDAEGFPRDPVSSCCEATVVCFVPGNPAFVPLHEGQERFTNPRCGQCNASLTEETRGPVSVPVDTDEEEGPGPVAPEPDTQPRASLASADDGTPAVLVDIDENTGRWVVDKEAIGHDVLVWTGGAELKSDDLTILKGGDRDDAWLALVALVGAATAPPTGEWSADGNGVGLGPVKVGWRADIICHGDDARDLARRVADALNGAATAPPTPATAEQVQAALAPGSVITLYDIRRVLDAVAALTSEETDQ